MMRWLAPVLAAALGLAGCGQSSESVENTADTTIGSPAPTDTSARPFCDAVKTRVTPDECADLTALKDSLYRGGAAVHADSPMQRGNRYTVTLLLDSRPARVIEAIERPAPQPDPEPAPPATEPADTAAPPPDNTTETPAPAEPAPEPAPVDVADEAETPGQLLEKLPGETERFSPWVGRFMRAELRGDGFDITPLDDPAKEVPDRSQVRWTWSVQPNQGGPQTLFVTTKVEGQVNGRTYLLAGSETFKSITVEVSMLDRVRDQFVYFTDWLKSLEGLIVALTAVAVAFFGLRAVIRNRGKPKT